MEVLIDLTKMIVSLFGFAGGGGSDSGSIGGSGGSDFGGSSFSDSGGKSTPEGIIFFLVILAISILWVILEEKYRKHRKHKNSLKEQRRFDTLDQNNTEQEKWAHEEAARIFKEYQQDWSEYNLKNIKEYTTDKYFQHASLMLEAIDRMNRRNVVSNLKISRTVLFSPINDQTKLPAAVTVIFKFSGTDGLVNTKTQKTIHSDHAQGLTEYWRFIYDGKSLKLDGIIQSTESTPHLIESIAEFARENNLFYSPDWGRLALPTKGLLFENTYDILGTADVNNHVVGKWSDSLIQIYTFSAQPDEPKSHYIVGQINIPKTYEGVIVESKKAKLKIKKPKDYDKYDLEWDDFNRRYNVFAASKDALPAFELLNPSFMERLHARNLPYNLEVKDNTIYIFAKAKEAKKEHYAELLNVITEAFKELKM